MDQAILRNPTFWNYALRTVLVNANVLRKTGNTWRVHLDRPIVGFNEREEYKDENVACEKLVEALSIQYNASIPREA